MFPRPSRLFRLIIILCGVIFIAISTYIITFDGSSTINVDKSKTKFSTTGAINTTPGSQLKKNFDGKPTFPVIQKLLHSPAGESSLLFHKVLFQQKLKENALYGSHDAGQMINIKTIVHEVNPHNFAYIHNPSNICQRNVAFLVYIHSSPENLKKRQAVRQTWGHPRLLSLYNATLMFVLGRVLNPVVQSLIDMEATQYSDILQEDFIDSYRNLTYKGLAGLKWASTFCKKTEFLLKTDDDILLDIVSFMESLHNKIIPSRGIHSKLVLCNVWTRMKVIREPKSKWYVSREEFPDEYFPAYCSGSAYLLSGDLIPALYEKALQTPFFWVDDYYVTGMLINKLKIQHTRFNSAYLLNYNVAEEKLKNDSRELMILHVKKLSLFLKLWPLLMQRHIGMEKYLVSLTNFPWRHGEQSHPDFNASDNVIDTVRDKESSDKPIPISVTYIFKM